MLRLLQGLFLVAGASAAITGVLISRGLGQGCGGTDCPGDLKIVNLTTGKQTDAGVKMCLPFGDGGKTPTGDVAVLTFVGPSGYGQAAPWVNIFEISMSFSLNVNQILSWYATTLSFVSGYQHNYQGTLALGKHINHTCNEFGDVSLTFHGTC
jgi:hypothetical protein